MTLAVVAGNLDQIILAVDRRITPAGTDASGSRKQKKEISGGKVGHAICDDASFLYCFTGLATVRAVHSTSRWLPIALWETAKQSHKYLDIVVNFSANAHSYFKAKLSAIGASDRRITFMFAGYYFPNKIVCSLISNFQDFEAGINYPEAKEAFSYWTEGSKDGEKNPTFVQAIGQFDALTSQDETSVRGLLETGAPAFAIRNKLVELVQDVSDRPKARGTVGRRITTARMEFSNPGAPIVGFASDQIENSVPLLDQVDLRTGASAVIVTDGRLSATVPVVVPRRHRNAPCPCGSGKKYRHCHGRLINR